MFFVLEFNAVVLEGLDKLNGKIFKTFNELPFIVVIRRMFDDSDLKYS